MAHTNAYANRTSLFSLGTLAHNLMDSIKASFKRQEAFSRTYRELNALSDRELNDIGLSRSMIHDIARVEADRV